MIELGNYNELRILRETAVGLFLGDDEVDDLLLPSKYVPDNFEIGDSLRVFCYLDHEERPIATTQQPLVVRNSFAYLKVMEVNQYGAFLDWGLEKQLFVPYREQQIPMEEGKRYVVFCYLDAKSFRLVASSRIHKFLDNSQIKLTPSQEIEALVYRKSNLGYDVVVNDSYRGLIFSNQVFKPIAVGDRVKGWVQQIREDDKIDIVLEPVGHLSLEPNAEKIYNMLQNGGGFLPFNDHSDPADIRTQFGLSKKAFKKAIGVLYKARKIEIKDRGIALIK